MERGEHLVRDSFFQGKALDFRRKLKIHFLDEQALDAGGPLREWLSEVTTLLFSQEQGLFKRTSSVTYFPEPIAGTVEDQIELLRFTGRLLGKAMIEKVPVSVKLNKVLLKELTSRTH